MDVMGRSLVYFSSVTALCRNWVPRGYHAAWPDRGRRAVRAPILPTTVAAEARCS